jgi:hypothetical protein
MSSKIFVDPLIGNVGIGTGLPSAQFHTNSTNGGRPLQIEQTASNVEFPPLGASNVGYYADYSDTVPSIDVGTPLTLVEYPPVGLISTDTTASQSVTVSGAFYGNGVYTTSGNNRYSTDYPPWKAFNKRLDATDGWISVINSYDATTGYAVAGVSETTSIGGINYVGSRLQIVLPSAITLKSYSFTPRTAALLQCSQDWIVAGSTNGTTWVLLDARTSQTTWNVNVYNTYTASNTGVYNYFRLVITRLVPGGQVVVSVGELKLFADAPLTTTGREYPPLPMTANTSLLNGSYGAGTYVARASSIYAGYYEYSSFNKLTSGWYTSLPLYSATSPYAYIGSAKTYDFQNNVYSGEWLQIKLQFPIILSSYKITSRNDSDYAVSSPTKWYLLGSLDETVWTLIDNKTATATTWSSAGQAQTFNVSSTTLFSYFRLVFININGVVQVVVIGEVSYISTQSTYPKYRTLLPATSSTYNPGTYSTYANTIYNATTIDATPPTFISDKILSNPWKTGANTYTNVADANPIPSIFFELPQAILLKSYQFTAPDTATAPSAWNVYGSNMAVAGGWVLTDGPRTSQIVPWTTSLTQTYTTSGTTTYNMFKFDLLRNASASANFIALNEIRLNGNDVLPDARITVNADGRVGINTPPAEVNTAAAMTVSGNMAVTGNISAGNLGMFRNRIINGDMRIDQRNAGAAVDVSGGVYTLDRWFVAESAATASCTAQQVRAPANPYGLAYGLLTTVTVAQAVIAVQEYCSIEQRIEGWNISDLMWGSSYASPIVLSFNVFTTQIGTYSIAIRNATFTTIYVSTFTVLVANQWTRVEKIIQGSNGGVWNVDNTIGLYLTITLAAGANWLTSNTNTWIDGSRAASGFGYLGFNGQVNFLGTVNNQFYLTGVQVEKGAIATPFEARPFGMELVLCQRYYEKSYSNNVPPGTITDLGCVYFTGTSDNFNNIVVVVKYCITKRAIPSISVYSHNSGAINTIYFAKSGSSGFATPTIFIVGDTSFGTYASLGGNYLPGYILFNWVAQSEL